MLILTGISGYREFAMKKVVNRDFDWEEASLLVIYLRDERKDWLPRVGLSN
jgi:hypothetical protein